MPSERARAQRFRPALKTVFSQAQRDYYEDPRMPDTTGTVSQGAVARNGEGARTKVGLARLLELASGQRGPIAGACLAAAAASFARLVPFLAVYAFIRELIGHWEDVSTMDVRFLIGCGLVAIAAAVLSGLLSYASLMLAHRAAFDVLLAVRVQLAEKLARIPSGWFTHVRQGELKKVLVGDVDQIEGFIGHNLPDAVSAIAMPVLSIAVLLFVDWRLALLLVVPIALSFILLGSSLGSPEGAACQVAMAKSAEKFEGTAVEFIHGMPVIKVFNRSLAAFKRFEHDARDWVNNVKWATWYNADGMGKMFAAIGTQLLFILPAAILLIPLSASYEGFVANALLFFLVASGMKEPVQQMIVKAVSLNSINASVARIDAILAEPEVLEPEHPRTPTSHEIRFENVGFTYEKDASPALSRVSFTADSGTITAIVGPSGSGKSTLAALALRFFDPSEGAVSIGDIDVREISTDDLARITSFVFQNSFILRATVEENIRMGSSATRDEVVAAARAAQIDDVIRTLPNGYDTVIGEGSLQLSGGERQRIAIARVMLRNAPIVILDEATAYADAESEARIQGALSELARGKTVIVIAHRIKTICGADKIVVLDRGTLAGTGTHSSLMEDCPLYRAMVEADERKGLWSVRAAKTRATIPCDTTRPKD